MEVDMGYAIIMRVKGKKSVITDKGSLPRMKERLRELRESKGKATTYDLVRIEEDDPQEARCCAPSCRNDAVARGVCKEHSDKDTRRCLGLGCEKWIVKRSRYHCLCEYCDKRNEGVGGKVEHAARFG
jgi:hypothetical protein